jgi:hypothetical protein
MNQLNVSIQQSIVAILAQGWSQRRIARELELNRETVARYAPAKPATNVALGVRSVPPSLCAPLALQIEIALWAGLSAQRIYQDLVHEHGFKGGYGSVKRFVSSPERRRSHPQLARGSSKRWRGGCRWVRPTASPRCSFDFARAEDSLGRRIPDSGRDPVFRG